MTIVVTPVRPGDALTSLRRAVGVAKGDDQLAPVTVVVPTNATGVTARRWLGATDGVAAVDMLTLYRVAEILGGPSLAADRRRPVSTPVVDIAVRRVLAEAPGVFADVAAHPSTVVALRDLHRELRLAGPDAPNRLAVASERGREAARVSTRVAQLLAEEWYDEGDLLRRSIERLDGGLLPPQLRRVVVFLPHPLRGLDVDLVRGLGVRGHVEALLAHVGEPSVDAEMLDVARALCRHAATSPTDGSPAAPSAFAATTSSDRIVVRSATDADEEVRHAVRAAVDAARHGTTLDRIAVLWPTDRPYARLVEHHLDVAGLPWNGRPGTAVAERVVPRFLLDLLDVDRRGLRRRDLFDLLADLPIRDRDGHYVPTARWERVSRAAGVARGDDWRPRLRGYAARERERASAMGLPSASRADDAEALLALVDDLRTTLGPRHATRTWTEWADWAERQIVHRLGRSFVDGLAVAERLAWDHSNRVLDRLRCLDTISGPVRRAEFRSAFAAEFDVAPGRLGRIGTGITIGSLASAAGLDVELAIVLGAADGLMPPAPDAGPLVGDAERAAAGLAPSTAVGARLHRQLRSVLDAAGRGLVLVPRGDLRSTALRLPSRWLADLADPDRTDHLASHHASLLATEFPAHDHEHRLRGHLAASVGGGPLRPGHRGDDAVLERALTMRSARRGDRITVYDGDLSGAELRHFDRPIAPTQLERWAECPHAYFVRHVLGVLPVEEPGDETELTALEHGNLVHRTLDRFHREVIAGALPQPAPNWSEVHRRRLVELFHETAGEFEASGRTGREASWWVARRSVLSELLHWLDHDSEQLRRRPASIVSSEQRFGDDGTITLTLPDGRELAVKGDIDRVDRATDGTLVVIDHKTGSARKFRAIDAEHPTADGTRFQLPVYAVGAWAIAGERTTVRAEYSFFDRERYRRIGYELGPGLDDEVWTQVRHDLGEVVAGIESGLFPNRPDVPGFQLFVACPYCQPDGLGTTERWTEWERKRSDPRGARWFAEADDTTSTPAGATERPV